MRVDIFVPSHSADEQLRFYVEELRLFEVAQDYGMGSVLLRHVTEPSICLELAPGRPPDPGRPLFCLSTDDCEAEFKRLGGVAFAKGGLVASGNGAPAILEYPLGKTFSVHDASGNLFLIAQWHPNAA